MDSEHLTFRYNSNQIPYSKIRADYLISGKLDVTDVFIFLVNNLELCNCCSKDHFLKASINALPNSIAFRTLLAFSELPPKLDSHPDVLSAILSATNRSTV